MSIYKVQKMHKREKLIHASFKMKFSKLIYYK